MSTYATTRIHPTTGKETRCIFLEHRNGFRFEGETEVYTEEELQALMPAKSYPDG